LWLRWLAKTTAQSLPGTEGATHPFWSPDTRSIAFLAGSALKRLDLDGGVPRTIAPVTSGQGATWNADGVILFAPTTISPLMRVPATGARRERPRRSARSTRPTARRTFCPRG
jgi:hypothetical protein